MIHVKYLSTSLKLVHVHVSPLVIFFLSSICLLSVLLQMHEISGGSLSTVEYAIAGFLCVILLVTTYVPSQYSESDVLPVKAALLQ